MPTAFLMKGVSATGKGTRMSTLIEYLKTVDTPESWFVNKIGNKEIKKPYQIAIHFPNVNITFMGRWVRSNKKGRMVSWSSLDAFSAYKENYFDILKIANSSHYCSEGYFGSKSFEPNTFKDCGYDKLVTDHFLFRDMEELQERCLGRSGSRIKGSCYSDNAYFLDENKKYKYYDYWMNMSKEANLEATYDYHWSDEPAYEWGVKVLTEIGLGRLQYDFIEFSKSNPTLRHVDNAQENIDKFSKYLTGDSSVIKYIQLPTISNEDLPFELEEGIIKVNEATEAGIN